MKPLFVTCFEENFPGADITDEAFVFLKAVERYQREQNRRFPTWREVLSIAHSLGYRRTERAEEPAFEILYAAAAAPQPPDDDNNNEATLLEGRR